MRRWLWLAWGAVACVAGGVEAADSGRTPLTAEVMWQIQRLSSPAVSPDGKWVALTVTGYDVKEDKALADIWLVPTAGGEARPLTTQDSSDTNPAWSPDGKWIAFESKRGDDENPQLYVIA